MAVNQSINKKATIEQWARYTVKDWHKALGKADIGQTGELARSIKYQFFFRGEELVKILFIFNMRGRFIDMGVGRGVKIGDVAELRTARQLMGKHAVEPRKPKKWIGQKFMFNVNRLSEIMAEQYGKKATQNIIQIIEGSNGK